MDMETILNPEPRSQNPIIYPVILAVPDKQQKLAGREKVAFLSRHARGALEISAQKSGVELTRLIKGENGEPLPFDGNYWSLTHKTGYVGGVIASTKIGMDLEKIRPCSAALFRKTAQDSEWRLSNADPTRLFFRYWTSKESVIKASGAGIRDLSKCRIVKIIDHNRLIINYRDQEWIIEHHDFDGHIVSVVKNNFKVEWTILPAPLNNNAEKHVG
ncbi:MAG: 4'-phosphopantetheinyl transferase superfamily protein [Desulfobacteraceae bacterium]|nr:4'-phosphopantetheinyl transferase superfamily protein [Desulfobacteraceae bacterium]